VEDVCDAEGEAEDDAEDAGPGVVSFAQRSWSCIAHTIVRIYLEASELAGVVLFYAPNGWRRALLLKFRDLNSSASVMLGESVWVWVFG
jgi:hypothetical protein